MTKQTRTSARNAEQLTAPLRKKTAAVLTPFGIRVESTLVSADGVRGTISEFLPYLPVAGLVGVLRKLVLALAALTYLESVMLRLLKLLLTEEELAMVSTAPKLQKADSRKRTLNDIQLIGKLTLTGRNQKGMLFAAIQYVRTLGGTVLKFHGDSTFGGEPSNRDGSVTVMFVCDRETSFRIRGSMRALKKFGKAFTSLIDCQNPAVVRISAARDVSSFYEAMTKHLRDCGIDIVDTNGAPTPTSGLCRCTLTAILDMPERMTVELLEAKLTEAAKRFGGRVRASHKLIKAIG